MNKTIIMVSILALLNGCNLRTNNSELMTAQKKQMKESPSTQDTTPRVTGIGGIFFFTENPEKTKEWYSKNLGLEVNEWGSSFEFRNANRPDEIN